MVLPILDDLADAGAGHSRMGPPAGTSTASSIRRPTDRTTPPWSTPTASWNSVPFPSTGTVRDSFDNAMAEAVNDLYKTELTRRRAPWSTVEQGAPDHPARRDRGRAPARRRSARSHTARRDERHRSVRGHFAVAHIAQRRHLLPGSAHGSPGGSSRPWTRAVP